MYTAEHLVLNIMMKIKKNTNGFNQTFSSLDISSGYLILISQVYSVTGPFFSCPTAG